MSQHLAEIMRLHSRKSNVSRLDAAKIKRSKLMTFEKVARITIIHLEDVINYDYPIFKNCGMTLQKFGFNVNPRPLPLSILVGL